MNIGNRLELFVDDVLIDRVEGVAQRLHQPTPREVAVERDAPWEGNTSGYNTTFQDGDLYRMYYRGSQIDEDTGEQPHPQFACYVESRDGIHWTKPELDIVEFKGSGKNNIIWEGVGTHNFTPFIDARPECPPEERYKALGGSKREGGLFAFRSSDGVHWSLLTDQPVITDGAFDSQNLAFWDTLRGEYRAYYRDFRDGLRDIKTCISKDFLTWTPGTWLTYPGAPEEHLYTNQVIPYYRAPHIFLGFPTRYVHDRGFLTSFNEKLAATQQRRSGTSYTDGLLMTSRDGEAFTRWSEAFIRPGPQGVGRWVYGDNYQTWGLVETRSDIAGEPNELSVYANEGARRGKGNRLRRYTLRIDGFVSMNAPLSGGEFVTKPLVFDGAELIINFATSAAGGVTVEIQDADGRPIPGYTLSDCADLFGDEIERVVTWSGDSDAGKLAGTPIRLRFALKDADLYSFCFR